MEDVPCVFTHFLFTFIPIEYLASKFVFQLAHGLDRTKNNRASSILVWDVIRETGAGQQSDANSISEFSNGLPADSLYNMEKIAHDIYPKDKNVQYFCDRPLCDACRFICFLLKLSCL